MHTKIIVLIAFMLLTYVPCTWSQESEQEEEETIPFNTGYVTLGVYGGVSTFFGDLNVTRRITNFNNFRPTIGLQAEKRFGKFFGVGLNGMFGTLAQNEQTAARQLNFETKFTQFGGSISGHFDWKSSVVVAPFFSVGVNFMNFDVRSDLKDKNGELYYYWTDGTIRNMPQKDVNGNIITYPNPPTQIERDYTYESPVNTTFDPSAQSGYSTTAMVIPITGGIKLKLFEFFETRLYTSYNIVNTDFMDNYSNNRNDAYINTGISIHYTLGKKYVSPQDSMFMEVDFKSIGQEDADNDGVNDLDDECPHTVKGLEVRSNGCPLDDDNDGVWNYLDKEPNSAPGATVNRDGITLTEQEIQKLYELREQVYMEKINKFYELPSDSMLQQIANDLGKVVDEEGSESSESVRNDEVSTLKDKVDSTSGKVLVLPMPEDAKFADKNGDGMLQATEITGAIDDFLDGNTPANVTDIMKMIEYFFEQ